MPDFLLELRSEEIPARMQAGARAGLEKLFREQLAAAGVAHGAVTVWSTPRRLALIVRDLPEATSPVREEVKGPRTSAPAQALEGFLRKTGLTRDQLTERGGVWFAITEKPGRAATAVLAEVVPAIVRAFPWPKSMRWGAGSISTESLRWVRPLSGVVAILGEELVTCEVGGVRSDCATLGHRFHHPGPITIGGAHDYAEKLRACHVIVDHAEREALIRDGARAAAAEAGLALVEDEGLVIENAGLTEWPVPLLGRFDEAFLEVPPEVIQLTARTNQKYFICRTPVPLAGGAGGGPVAAAADLDPDKPSPDPSRGREGSLANAFVCTANIAASDGGAGIVAGNRKVLAARLSDARFFWEQDRKLTLEQHAQKLTRITFHEKLGTVADKVERVAKLARWLVEEGIVKSSPQRGEGDQPQVGGGVFLNGAQQTPPPSFGRSPSPSELGEDKTCLADLAERAARLSKADLVTEMVGEFPELQGLMGGYYARAEGLPDEVADAIRDHYKPVGQGDDVPTAPVTVAVSLADKLDTIVSFFLIGDRPSGSKDPFAIRRSALGVLRIILKNEIRMPLLRVLLQSAKRSEVYAKLPGFYHDLDELSEVYTDVALANEVLLLSGGPFSWELWLDGRLSRHFAIETDATSRFSSELSTDVTLDFGNHLLEFLADRLKVQQREAGVRHDLIDAVFALGGEDDLVRLLARVHALQAFIGSEDGANLLAGYKRVASIIKKEGYEAPFPSGEGVGGGGSPDRAASRGESPHPNPSPQEEVLDAVTVAETLEPAEQALHAALDAAVPQAAAAVAGEDFAGAMAALASLRAPIDRFFEDVTVNDPDPGKRAGRLALLDRFRAAVHNVADFSRIEG